MNIKIVKVGALYTNCYILSNNVSTIIIDPGDNASKIINNIDKRVIGILITHYHDDHIGALDDLLNYYKCSCYDYKNLKEGTNKLGLFTFDVIKTPGHTSDSISFLFNHDLFCGDFIFYGSIGRTDLPSGSMIDMRTSLKKILEYHDLNIYPGHGEVTTLEYERSSLKSYL